MSGSLSGEIQDFGIADVLQLIGQQGKSGILKLRREKQAVEIHFAQGRIACAQPESTPGGGAFAQLWVRCGGDGAERIGEALRAAQASALELSDWLVEQGWASEDEVRELRDLLTRESLFEVMQWTSGSFGFQPVGELLAPAASVPVGVEQALMEGLRRVDEWRELQPRSQPPETIFRWTLDPETIDPALVRVDPALLARMAPLIDAKRAMREVIDLSRAGTFEATRVLVDLSDLGAIEPVVFSRRAPDPRRSLSSLARVGGCLDALLPLALLAAMTWALLGSPQASGARPDNSPAGGPHEFTLERKPLQWLRSSYASLAARRAEDASRISRVSGVVLGTSGKGPWPRDPEPLAAIPGQS